VSEILVGTGPVLLTKQWEEDGTVVDAGAVTVGIVDANSVEVVAPLTATTKSGSGATTNYTYSLAKQTTVKLLTVTWTRTETGAILVDRLEVIGGVLFTESELRAFDNAALADTTLYTDAKIAAMRQVVTSWLEDRTGRSWVPRYTRGEFMGTGDRELWLRDAQLRASSGEWLNRPGAQLDPRQVISSTIDGVSATDITLMGSSLWRNDGVWTSPPVTNPLNVVVEWEYGMPYPVGDVGRVAKLLAELWLQSSDADWLGRAGLLATEFGTVRLDALPRDVVGFLNKHNYRVPIA
jgi:hypothetical protein